MTPAARNSPPEVWVVRAGDVPYEDALRAQKRIERARHAEIVPDVMLLLEHPPVYTRGRRTTDEELPMGEDWYRMQGIEVTRCDRGGRATYHGPGQLVCYPIMSLRPYRDDVHDHLRRLERVAISALADFGVEATTIEGLTGVWTKREQPRKIGSIGVHVNRSVTTHGLAVNVNNDLQPFQWIVPCGLDSCRVSSVCREFGTEQDMDAFADAVGARFGEIYEREPVEVSAAELAEEVGGLGALAERAPALR